MILTSGLRWATKAGVMLMSYLISRRLRLSPRMNGKLQVCFCFYFAFRNIHLCRCFHSIILCMCSILGFMKCASDCSTHSYKYMTDASEESNEHLN